jgi:hypothetical protein
MYDNWRPQATIAITTVVLLPLWMLTCYALDHAPWAAGGFCIALLAAFLIFVVGIVSGISGAREGSSASRRASKVCLFLLVTPVIIAVVYIVWFLNTKPRWA